MTRLLGPLPADVLEVVVELTGIPADVIVAKRGRNNASNTRVQSARLIAYWASRQFGGSLKEIGAYFDRDHRSVISGVKRVEADPSLHAIAIEVANAVQERFGGLTVDQRTEAKA